MDCLRSGRIVIKDARLDATLGKEPKDVGKMAAPGRRRKGIERGAKHRVEPILSRIRAALANTQSRQGTRAPRPEALNCPGRGT